MPRPEDPGNDLSSPSLPLRILSGAAVIIQVATRRSGVKSTSRGTSNRKFGRVVTLIITNRLCSYHGEGPNRFSCEFCGRGQFNRRDNLNNHRRLHTRHNSRNRGVEFVPDAVMVIEQEKLRRTPTRRRKQGGLGGTNYREIQTQ